MTTPQVTGITDEQLADLERTLRESPGALRDDNIPRVIRAIIARLRATEAEVIQEPTTTQKALRSRLKSTA